MQRARTLRARALALCGACSITAGDVGLNYLKTVKVRVVDCVLPPPVPVILIEYVPVLAVLATFSVKFDVPAPGAAIDAGLKLPVTPDGSPLAESETAELNPPTTVVVTVTYPLCP
jgi:hypothetical protein